MKAKAVKEKKKHFSTNNENTLAMVAIDPSPLCLLLFFRQNMLDLRLKIRQDAKLNVIGWKLTKI